MEKSLLDKFGSPHQRVKQAVKEIKRGNGVLLVDDEDRENEGDLIFCAETILDHQMAMLIRDCSGIVCLCLTEEKISTLNLAQMAPINTNKQQTAFTVSIEAACGVTTGVSAHDRVITIKTAVAPDCTPSDLCQPGHVFPLRAAEGGVLTRRGHTEGTVDLMRLAGFLPAGILCELTNPDGTMSRLPQIVEYAHRHGMTVVSIDDIVMYRTSGAEI